MKRDEGSWRENPATGTEPEVHRGGSQVSLSLGMQTDNEFNLSYVYLRNRDIPDYGFSFDNATREPNTNFTPDHFWGVDGNFDNDDVSIATAVATIVSRRRANCAPPFATATMSAATGRAPPSATVAPGNTGLNLPSTKTGPTRSMDYETLTLQVRPQHQLPRARHEA